MKGDERTDGDSALDLVDLVIADLSAGLRRYVGRRVQDEADDTVVLQDGEEGRLVLERPNPGSPSTVLVMARTAQRHLTGQLGEPVPCCPLHHHALELARDGAGFEWLCPAGRWRCGLGDYAERAWPQFAHDQLSQRLHRRGVTGVRSLGVELRETGPVARFTVSDLTAALVDALSDAAAPVTVEVSEHPRQPRRAVEPIASASGGGPDAGVRLALSKTTVIAGGDLGYSVVNDSCVPVLTGLNFELDQQDSG